MAKSTSFMRRPTLQRDASSPTSSVSIPSVTLLMSAPVTMTIDPNASAPTSLLYNTLMMSSSDNDDMASGTPTPTPPASGTDTPGTPLDPPAGMPIGPPPPNPPPPQGIPGPEELASRVHIPPWVIAIICIILAIMILLFIILLMRLCRSRRDKPAVYKAHIGKPWDKEGALPASDTLTPLNPRNSLLISTPKRMEKKARDGRKRPLKRPGTAESIGKRVVESLTSMGRPHAPPKLVISNPIPVPNITLEPPTPSSSIFTGLSTAPSFESGALQPATRPERSRNANAVTDNLPPAPPSKRRSIHIQRGTAGDEAYEMVHLNSVEPIETVCQISSSPASNHPPASVPSVNTTTPIITVTATKETDADSPRSEMWDGYQDYLDFAETGPSSTHCPSVRDTSEVKSRNERWSECKSASSSYSEMRSQSSAQDLAAVTPDRHRLLHSSSVFEHGAGWKDLSEDDVPDDAPDNEGEDEDASDLSQMPVLTASPSADTTASVNIALWELVLGHGSVTSMSDLIKNSNARKSRLSEMTTASPVLRSPLVLSTSDEGPATFGPVVSHDIPEVESMSRASCWSFLDDLEGEAMEESNKVDGYPTTRNSEGVPHVSPLRIAKRAMNDLPSTVPHESEGRPALIPLTLALSCDDFTVDISAIPELNDDSMSGDHDNSTVEDHLPSSPPPTDILMDLLSGIPWYDGFEEKLAQPMNRVVSKRLKPSRIPVRRISKRRSTIGNMPWTPKAQVYLRSAIPSPVYATSARPRRAPTSAYARSHQKTAGIVKRTDGAPKSRSSLIPGSFEVTTHSGMKGQVLGRRVSITRKTSIGQASLVAARDDSTGYVDFASSTLRIPQSSMFL